MTLPEVLARCPYRTVFGPGGAGVTAENWNMRMPMPTRVLAVLGGTPEPISPRTMREIVQAVRAGQTVMLLADRADLRDYAKREIAAMLGPAGGRA